MSYHGAILNGTTGRVFATPHSLGYHVARNPQDVIITKTEPHQYAGPLTLGPERIAVGGPDPESPDWIAVIVREKDGRWKVL